MKYDWEPIPPIFGDDDPVLYWQMSDHWPDPVPFNASRAVVFPSNKKFANGQITATCTGWSQPDKFLETLRKGVTLPSLREGLTDNRIILAGELYCFSGFEASDRAKFLTLCTALEVLAPRPKLPQETQALVEKWRGQVRSLATGTHLRKSKREALASLEGGLASLGRYSITASLKKHVYDVLLRDGKFPAEKSSRDVKRLYNIRSKIIHGGSNVHHEDMFELEKITRMTLIAELRLQDVIR